MVVQAALMLFGSFFVMLFAGVPISAGIGIASIITAIMSGMDGNIFALTAARDASPAAIPSPFWPCRSFHWAATL